MEALSYNPPRTLQGFTGHPDTLAAMKKAALGPRGEQSFLVRAMTERVIAGIQGKDYLGEILAIRHWVAEHVRYVNDPLHVELVKDPQRMMEEILRYGQCSADCDEIALLIATMCLCIGRVVEFVVAGFGSPGEYSHVFAHVKEPRSGKWIITDPVAGTDERGMSERVTTFYVVSLDEP